MNMRTALIITGDTSTAKKAVEDLAAGVTKAAGPAKDLNTALGGVGKAATGASGALVDNARSAEQLAAAQGLVVQAVNSASAAASSSAQSARANEAATADMTRAAGALTGAVRELAEAQNRAIAASRADIEETRRLTEERRQASQEASRLADAERKAAAAIQEETRALDVFRRMLDPTAAATGELNRQLELAARLHQQGKLSEEEHIRVKQRLNEASTHEIQNLGLQRAGWQGVGFQLQDSLVQYEMGTRLSTIFAQQSGQLAGAIQMIAQSAEGTKGKLGSLAAFLGGGWGVAMGVAIPLVAMLTSSLLDTDDALEKVKFSSSDLSDSQSLLSSVMDIATGKMKVQTSAAMGLALAQAYLNRVLAQKKAAELTDDVKSLQDRNPGIQGGIGGGISFVDRTPGAQRVLSRQVLERAADPTGKAGIDTATAIKQLENLRRVGVLTDEAYAKAASAVASLGIELQNAKIADATVRLLEGNGTADDRSLLLKPNKPPKPKKDHSAEKAARERKQLEDFGDRSAESIARLDDQYNTAPRDIDRARQATASLDAIIKDVNERLTTSKNLTAEQRQKFDEIKAAAGALKPVIEESLAKPIRDMLEDQQREIDVGKLRASGRAADAEALQLTQSLMDKMGVETEAQLATELEKRGVRGEEVRQLYDNLAIMREQTREMRVQQEIQRAWLGSIDSMRQNLNQTLRDLRQEGPKAIGDFFKRSMGIVDQLFADVVTEKLFGGLFRDLEDQVTGADRVSKAGDKMADAVDTASGSLEQFSKDLNGAIAVALGKSPGSADSGAIGTAGAGIAASPDDNQEEIVVFAKIKEAFKGGYEGVFDKLKRGLGTVLGEIFGDGGIFSEELARGLGEAVAGGQFGASISSMLGVGNQSGTSQVASFIGGAIGEKAGEKLLTKGLDKVIKGLGDFAGPIGSIIGAVGGSLLGGIIKGKPGLGATVVTSVSGSDPGAWGRKGQLENSLAVGGAVQDNLQKIIKALGGVAGQFSVGLGAVEWQGATHYRVSAAGRYDVGSAAYGDNNGGDMIYSGTSAEEAARVAIMNAIADGAVGGLSEAVKKALNSSADLDEAISRALKVRDLQESLGGVGAEMAKAFRDLEKEAAERLGLARDYGLDVVAVEKKNAEERTALVEKMAEEQIGGLQRLIDDMTTGSLYEGSAVDQRTALLDAIGKAKADVDGGVDGAADVLANLYSQLNTVSKDAFGTTGQYAADRSMILDQARAAIAAANARIEASGKTSDPAIAQTNKALDENNDQNSQVISLLQSLPADFVAALSALGKGGTLTVDVAALARTS